MSKTKQTWYTKSNSNTTDTIKADIQLLSATPSDTTVLITPKSVRGTTHKVTWPSIGSKTEPKVYMADPYEWGGFKEDQDFDSKEMWLNQARQAWKNAEDKLSLWSKIIKLFK